MLDEKSSFAFLVNTFTHSTSKENNPSPVSQSNTWISPTTNLHGKPTRHSYKKTKTPPIYSTFEISVAFTTLCFWSPSFTVNARAGSGDCVLFIYLFIVCNCSLLSLSPCGGLRVGFKIGLV